MALQLCGTSWLGCAVVLPRFTFEALMFTLASLIRVARCRYHSHGFDHFCMYNINLTDLHPKWNNVTYDRHPRVGGVLQAEALLGRNLRRLDEWVKSRV